MEKREGRMGEGREIKQKRAKQAVVWHRTLRFPESLGAKTSSSGASGVQKACVLLLLVKGQRTVLGLIITTQNIGSILKSKFCDTSRLSQVHVCG